MCALLGIRDAGSTGEAATAALSGGLYSPAKEKAANRAAYISRSALSIRRARQLVCAAKVKLLLAFCVVCVVVFLSSKISSFMGWNPHNPSSVHSPARGGYTVLISAQKRNSFLKKSVAHYASCIGTDAIHVVWSESNPPLNSLKAYLNRVVMSKSQKAHKLGLQFHVTGEESLNNKFKPIGDLRTDAIFSVDDGVIVPCCSLDFAFAMWQSTPLNMVGFIPRMHWFDQEKNGVAYYKYGGWWSVWWMGTYSMVLSKAAFFHRNYLNMYTYEMPPSVRDYVYRETICEDIAMSLLVANATAAAPIWVKGKIYEMGSSGLSSLKGDGIAKDKCFSDFILTYGHMPLVSTNLKAVDSRQEWFW